VRVSPILIPVPKYEYTCYVTNLDQAPIEIYRLYKDRGECENWIAAVKGQLNAGTTVMQRFWGSNVLWNLAVLAYNLTIWVRYQTNRNIWRQEPATFRSWFIRVAGKPVWNSREYRVKIPRDYQYRDIWWQVYSDILKIKFA